MLEKRFLHLDRTLHIYTHRDEFTHFQTPPSSSIFPIMHAETEQKVKHMMPPAWFIVQLCAQPHVRRTGIRRLTCFRWEGKPMRGQAMGRLEHGSVAHE